MADETQPAESAVPEPVAQPDSPSVEPDQDEVAALTDSLKKDELVAAAQDASVPVASADTKTDIAEKLVAQDANPLTAAPVAQPVKVDNLSRRSDDDSLEGGWVDIVAGDYQGRRGSFESVEEYDSKTGYPKTILVRTRDEKSELLAVAYSDTRPATGYLGGR